MAFAISAFFVVRSTGDLPKIMPQTAVTADILQRTDDFFDPQKTFGIIQPLGFHDALDLFQGFVALHFHHFFGVLLQGGIGRISFVVSVHIVQNFFIQRFS